LAIHIGVTEYISQTSICAWMVGSCPQRWAALHKIMIHIYSLFLGGNESLKLDFKHTPKE
jgi:hypothetical protein